MPSDTTSEPAAGPNKAQAEFDNYMKRRQAQAAGPGFPPLPGDGLSWAAPFGPGMAPVFVGGPAPGPIVKAADKAAGGLIDSIGTTARLGVDLLNAALSSGVKILGGFTGAYGHGHHDEGCGCESCCEPSCCEPSCCGCESCHPSVGSCC